MILNTTHSNREHKKIIAKMVGKPFSLLQMLKLKGVGSKRMIIEEVSPNMRVYLNKISDINYGNIELRPTGILIRINKGLQNYTWIIPYYQFYVYKIKGISIHAQGKYVNFKNNKTLKENTSFFKKLSRLKVAYDYQYPHIDMI